MNSGNASNSLEAILTEVNSGYGFVPIIGSGLSAPAGKKKDRPEAVDLRTIKLQAPAENVVDSCFIHITAGRQPCVGHMMLAHLSDALRIQTILTTNFDSLTEEAFARLGMPLTTFDVHQKAGLPSAQLVLAQRAVVKLHGGRYGLRADYSLNKSPPGKDKKAFAGFFRRPNGPSETARKHMLVMGVSGTDERTMNLIEYAVRQMPNLNVYWICYREDEASRIRDRLDGACQSRDAGAYSLTEKLNIRVEPDLGLFLLELYQRHYLSLPPAGADYPAIARVPPQVFQLDENKAPGPATTTRFDEYEGTLRDAIQGHAENDNGTRWVTAVGGDRGRSSTAIAPRWVICDDCDERFAAVS